MHPAFLPLPRRFLYAIKPASWPKLLVPMIMGQVLGALSAGAWSWGGAAVGLAYTLALLVHVVLLNDWFDARVDAIKRQMFPEAGSPKTIPDAILHPQTVLLAGLGAGLCAASLGLCGELVVGRPGLALVGLAGPLLLVAYSAPPVRLNERGLGEYVEAIGAGAVLPWIGAYLQSGEVAPRALLLVLPGLLALAFSSAVASGLADEESDRAGAKETLTTLLGNPAARGVTEAAVLVGALCWAISARVGADALHPLAVSAALAVVLWHVRAMVAVSSRATTHAFPELSRYKQSLHRAIWGGGLTLVAALALLRLLGVDGG
jgi:1,4-dihydroxy-2-naphthoate octaprenyltransferase/chlorophyll synthase